MNKLIRDLIPELVKRKENRELKTRVLDDQEYLQALLDKLKEESAELKNNPSLEELADVAEVTEYIAKILSISDKELREARSQKRLTNGGFDQRLLLIADTRSKNLNDVRFIQKCILLNEKKELLTLKRALGEDRRAGKWDLPGGRLEEGEEVLEAIRREVQEEVGLIAKSLDPIHLMSGVHFANDLMMGEQVFAVCYTCRDWEGEVVLSDEHTEYKWVTIEEFSRLDFGNDGGFFIASTQAWKRRYSDELS